MEADELNPRLPLPAADGLQIFLLGKAPPQGSWGAGLTKGGRPYAYQTESRELKRWRNDVAFAAALAMSKRGMSIVKHPAAVEIVASFTMARPKAHYRADGSLRENAPMWFTSKSGPDGDKQLRALLDALAGTVYENDGQVAVMIARTPYDAVASTSVIVRLA